MDKKAYFFCMTVCHHRTGAAIGKRCGIVFVDSATDAERIVQEKYGGDNTYLPWIQEITEEGFAFTVYKSEI